MMSEIHGDPRLGPPPYSTIARKIPGGAPVGAIASEVDVPATDRWMRGGGGRRCGGVQADFTLAPPPTSTAVEHPVWRVRGARQGHRPAAETGRARRTSSTLVRTPVTDLSDLALGGLDVGVVFDRLLVVLRQAAEIVYRESGGSRIATSPGRAQSDLSRSNEILQIL